MVKSLDLVVVRDQTGEQDITPGHAVADGHVRVRETQALLGQAVDVWRGAGQLAAKGTDRVGAHIIDRDEQNIHRGGLQGRGEGKQNEKKTSHKKKGLSS